MSWVLDLIGCLGWGVGGFTIAMRGRTKAPKLRPCSCEHGYGYHKDGKRCQETVQVAPYRYEQCACQVFDGEVPVDVYGRL